MLISSSFVVNIIVYACLLKKIYIIWIGVEINFVKYINIKLFQCEKYEDTNLYSYSEKHIHKTLGS